MDGPTDVDSATAEHGFLLRLLADRERGEELDLEGYQALFPGHEETVARKYAELHGPDAEDDASPAQERLGPFRILRELGRGGQGTVYLAEDTRLARRVALKVLPPAFGPGAADRLRRFRREAEAASRLEHPNICTIHEAGQVGGVAYIAMRHVRGETLRAKIERAKRTARPGAAPAPLVLESTPAEDSSAGARLAALVRLFEDLARALHHAHEHGLVHRDVKPGNIMITDDGTPVILDFGLAHDEHDVQATLTRTGDVLGTPAYMSPEQLQPAGEGLDRRTDVYSLGATLYECLTLRPPFEAPTREDLYRRILSADRSSTSWSRRQVPRDLQVVVDAALERDRARRYRTALDLAEDLRRVRELRPIRARPPGPLRRLQRWSRRNPAAVVALVLLVGGLTISGWQLARERALLRDTRALGLARAATDAIATDPVLGLLLAREALQIEERAETVSALHAVLPEVHERARLVGHGAATVSVAFWDVAFSPDGNRIVTASEDGTARVWDLQGNEVCPALVHAEDRAPEWRRVTSARFTPDGQRILTTCADGVARLWDLEGGLLGELDHGTFLWTASFAHHHDWVVLAGTRDASVWDLGTLEEITPRLGGHAAYVQLASFSPDDERILTADGYEGASQPPKPFTARLWDLWGSEPAVLAGHEDWHMAAAFSPDGTRILTASQDGRVLVRDEHGEPLFPIEHGGRLGSAAFAPDGSILTAGKGEAEVRLWSPGGEPRWGHPGHTGMVVMAAFSPDGGRVVTASMDQTARVLDASSGMELAVLRGHRGGVSRAAFHTGGNLVTTVSMDGTARVWEVDAPELPVLRGHSDSVNAVCFSRDGERIATASSDGTVALWSASGEWLGAAPGLRGDRVSAAVISPHDDGEILIASVDGGLHLWDVESNALRQVAEDEDLITATWDGERILSAHRDGVARIRDLEGAGLRELRGPLAWTSSAEFSPDGRLVVTASKNGTARVWDVERAEVLAVLPHPEEDVRAASFSPDGRRVVTGSSGQTVRVWNWREERTVRVLRGHEAVVTSVTFSADGRRVLTAAGDGTVRLWDAADGAELACFVHAGGVSAAALSPDGGRILAGCWDKTARVWLADTRDALELSKRWAFRDFTPAERERYRELLPSPERTPKSVSPSDLRPSPPEAVKTASPAK